MVGRPTYIHLTCFLLKIMSQMDVNVPKFSFRTFTLKITVGFSALLHWNFLKAIFHLIFVVHSFKYYLGKY